MNKSAVILRCTLKCHLVIVTTVPDAFETILREQPRHLSEHFRITLITSDMVACAKLANSENVDVRCVPMHRGISPVRDLIAIFRMAIALFRLRPDIVHSYTPKAGLVAMVGAKLAGVGIRAHTFTGLIFPTSTGPKKFVLWCCDRVIASCASHVIPEGRGVRSDLLKHSVTKKPLAIIGHGNIAGVDIEYFCRNYVGLDSDAADLREKLSISSDDFVFCYAGRLHRDKGLLELSRAFRQLAGDNIKLLLIGSMDATAPVADEIIRDFKSDRRVSLCGFQKDIRPFLTVSNVLVLPSYREGFPNVLLQAGAMGLPAIASDVNGCNEIIIDSANGWLIPPRNTARLCDAMSLAMALNPVQLRAMGKTGRQLVCARFERTQYWACLKQFYRTLLHLDQGNTKAQLKKFQI